MHNSGAITESHNPMNPQVYGKKSPDRTANYAVQIFKVEPFKGLGGDVCLRREEANIPFSIVKYHLGTPRLEEHLSSP